MNKSIFLILVVILIVGSVLSSCRKLPPLPDDYETLFAEPGNFAEINIPCNSQLDDNVIFTDYALNGNYYFVVSVDGNYYNGNSYFIEATDESAGVRLEIEIPALSSSFINIFQKYLAWSNSFDTEHKARVKLFETEEYSSETYLLSENCDLYVQYTQNQIIISLCELTFKPQYGTQFTFTLSGRIIYNK